MKRITGTHIYTYQKCAHAVALDLHEDRARRRPPTEVEEFVLARGRDLEARLVADLGYAEPQFAERDFDAGAAATRGLMLEGVSGIAQGVLVADDRLGIPDLLRREAGASELGDHHYVVGDIKSSRTARSDQILQIMFYSGMLGRLQGRIPEDAYLLLRDGHEERFACADFAPVIAAVERGVLALRASRDASRSFLNRGCRTCHWSEMCLPDLEARDDLSLLQGMTRGLRETLEGAGYDTGRALVDLSVEPTARRTKLESALLRRLVLAARARAAGAPIPESGRTPGPTGDFAVVHLLGDPFAERVHYFGALYPARSDGAVHEVLPATAAEEWPAFVELLAKLPKRAPIWHYGAALPRWYEEAAWRRHAGAEHEARFVDLQRRLRGAAVYPGPVFGLASHVEMLLGEAPHRAGDAAAVGMWIGEPDAPARLRAKGHADLFDLAALSRCVTEGIGVGPDT